MKPFKLENEPKITSGFTTPEGYFDSFAEKIATQLPTTEPKVISIFSRRTTWYYVAAAIVLMLMALPVYNNYSSNTEAVEVAALEDYLTNHSAISNDEMATLLEKEDLEKMKLELNLQDEAIEDILLNSNDLEQYITN